MSGRLAQDQDPAGGSKTFSPVSFVPGGMTTTLTTAMNVATTYETLTTSDFVLQRQNTLPNGLTSRFTFDTTDVSTSIAPDGTTTVETDTPDPRLGLDSPVRSVKVTTPAGLTRTETTTRTVTGSDGGLASTTEQMSVAGIPGAWTRAFDPSALTWTTTSPVGRSATVTVDAADRPTNVTAPGVTPVQMTYDSHGRLASVTQGTFAAGGGAQPRTWTMSYDGNGFLASVTDPMGSSVAYTNDSVGRPQHTRLPEVDGGTRDLQTAFDGDDNVTAVTLPRNTSQEQHELQYTPADQLSLYSPPAPGAGTWSTSDEYDLDHRLTRETRPDGATIVPDYDSAGRLAHITAPQGITTMAYYPGGGPSPGHLKSIAAPNGETLTYAYDGPLATSASWSGAVNGSVGFGYDTAFRVTSQTINGGSSVAFAYDADDLLTSAGAVTSVAHDTQNGRIAGSTLGAITDAYAYDANGLLATYTGQFTGLSVYVETVLSRDGDQRITERTETIAGTTTDWTYRYDVAGRLTDVSKNGVAVSHYGYDADDNRTNVTIGGVTVNPSYDVQDRLQTYGNATYAYGPNGELQSKTAGSQVTGTIYDVFGNLLHVALPDGTAIDYLVDGQNRRIRKQVNGTTTSAFIYLDALRPAAQLDGQGNVVARFVYATRSNVPDYMTTPTGTYRIFSDHLGSPRLVANVATGAIAQRLDYDEFGNVTQDTSPGFQPFGFAGGLYDKDTGLVRFGARDYDPSVGRWTSKGSRTNKSIEGDRQDLSVVIYGSGGRGETGSPEVAFAEGHDERARASIVGRGGGRRRGMGRRSGRRACDWPGDQHGTQGT